MTVSPQDDLLDVSQGVDARDADLVDAVDEAVIWHLAQVNTCAPGVVQAYDRATQRASVQLANRIRLADGTTVRAPQVLNAPVMFPGASGFSISWDVPVGAEVLVLFAQSSLDEWLSRGGSDATPRDPRRFDGKDAIILPGLRSAPNRLSGAAIAEGALTIKNATGITLELRADGVATLTASEVRLGGDAATPLALASATQSAIDALWAAMVAVYTWGASVTPPLPPVPPFPATPNPPDVAASKAKGE